MPSKRAISMAWFQLDPDSTLERIRRSGRPAPAPTLAASLVRGIIGFALLGVAGFFPWVLGLGRTLGEGGMYAACAAVFIALSGVFLHSLLIGPGSLARFYPVFALGFGAYAAVYSAFWFAVKFPGRDYAGIVLGSLCFAAVLCAAFGRWRALPPVVAALAVLQAGGYFLGGVVYQQAGALAGTESLGIEWTRRDASQLARTLWGVFYGIGFGAGIGLAFHVVQAELRARLAAGQGKESAAVPANSGAF
jgi:hypothetical protein